MAPEPETQKVFNINSWLLTVLIAMFAILGKYVWDLKEQVPVLSFKVERLQSDVQDIKSDVRQLTRQRQYYGDNG